MKIFIGLLLSLVAIPSLAEPEAKIPTDFVKNVAKAQIITDTPAGVIYDNSLSEYFSSLPTIREDMSNCLDQNPGSQWLIGYFEFKESGDYTLHLEPKSSFSKCIAKIFNNKKPPKPSVLPYNNSFEFTHDDTKIS